MVLIDMDGTLLTEARTVAPEDLKTLEELPSRAVVRVIATGRNPFSFFRVAGKGLPLDFLILSSGAALWDYARNRLIRSLSMEPDEVGRAAELFARLGLELMIHDPVPENHRFAYFSPKGPSGELMKRLELYEGFARPLSELPSRWWPASQLLAIDPGADGGGTRDRVATHLPDLAVIRATSPLTGSTTWIEVFARGVSKSLTGAWLAAQLGLPRSKVMAVGNDYNDLDMLEWAGRGYAVRNAQADLRDRFTVVASHNEAGVSEAVRLWLASQRGGV